jgi:hypothetical protein
MWSTRWYWQCWLAMWQSALLAGLTAWEDALHAVAARRELLPRRMAALGVDPTALGRAETARLSRLAERCVVCDSAEQCAWDLAENPADPAWQQYCPHARQLAALNEH